MRQLDEFDVSDVAAVAHPGWRVRWGEEGSNMVLLVNMETSADMSRWVLGILDKGDRSGIQVDDYGFALTPGTNISYYYKTVTPDMELPTILKQCYEDHYNNVPAPRRILSAPLLTHEEAVRLENGFLVELLSKYLQGAQVFSIKESGTLLANRLGITSIPIEVKHYQQDTFQDDDFICPKISEDFHGPVDAHIVIIDDMISSGRTAKAVIRMFRDKGYSNLDYVTLFDILASREVHDFQSYIHSYKIISNFYWLYGRGMDLRTRESRLLQSLCGADKSFGISDKEDVDDLRNFFCE